MASVSAVVGSGNIAGVATAIAAGGPGALFWMLVAALVGMATKFADTFVVCLVSGLTIVLSGLWDSGAEGVALTMRAFSLLFPGNWSQYIVLCASILFGYSCLITYYNYMEKCWINLVGSTKGKFILRCIWIVFIIISSFSSLGFVWDLADTCNGHIIIPNLIALVIMAKQVVEIKDDFYRIELPAYKEEKRLKTAGR